MYVMPFLLFRVSPKRSRYKRAGRRSFRFLVHTYISLHSTRRSAFAVFRNLEPWRRLESEYSA
jgi:hypothetical protein